MENDPRQSNPLLLLVLEKAATCVPTLVPNTRNTVGFKTSFTSFHTVSMCRKDIAMLFFHSRDTISLQKKRLTTVFGRSGDLNSAWAAPLARSRRPAFTHLKNR